MNLSFFIHHPDIAALPIALLLCIRKRCMLISEIFQKSSGLMHFLTYSSSTCFSLVMNLFHSFFTSSVTSISQGKFWLQRLCRILPSSTNGNIVLLVKDVLLSNFLLKEKVSSVTFHHIPNALSVGRSPDKFLSFVPCHLCCSGIDCNNSLLFETNFVRLKSLDLHILITSFTSCLAMFILHTDFKR